MNIQLLLNALQLREDKDWEFKSAKGGLPGALWETYSAMANTDGGLIVLGVKELDGGGFEVQGLDDPDKLEKNFWNCINDRSKVNVNLLSNGDVRLEPVDGKTLLVVQVPRATRRQRPVYVGQNPLIGTYRRFNDGDYKCTPDEVGRMLADQSEQTADSRILPNFSAQDLDAESLRQYRNRFSARNPNHAWLNEDTTGFLRKLGGWGRNRETNEDGLTVAGLLMFGNEDALNDPAVGVNFHLDYRERISNSIGDRWADRITIDGTWTPNLFQFFQRVYPKLVEGLKLPFAYQTTPPPLLFSDPIRSGMSPTHEAVQEALVNSLIHADYRGQGGIVIDRFPDRIELSNPGTLLVSFEQLQQGAVSECRNPSLQRMFQMMGAGDKAGSGIDKIKQGWASQKWRVPLIEEYLKPDRVKLVLPMVSLLPEESLVRLRAVLGEKLGGLNAREVQALVTADVEGSVTNQRLQQFSSDHTTDITRMLQDLVSKEFLVKDGYGRWASYRLAERVAGAGGNAEGTPDTTAGDSEHKEPSSSHKVGNSSHNAGNSSHNEGDSLQSDQFDPALLVIAEQARAKSRLTPETMQDVLTALCAVSELSLDEIGRLLQRNARGIRNRYLSPMVQSGRMQLRFPDEPNHPKQAYRTNPDWKAS